MKTAAVAAAILLLAAWSGGTPAQAQERDCEYEGLTARCGELLLLTRKNYRTNALHPMTEDLRRRISEEGGRIVREDADLALIVARFDHAADALASVLERLRSHQAVSAADYNFLSAPDGIVAVD